MTKKSDEALLSLMNALSGLSTETLIDQINKIKTELHKISPFRDEPVDCVRWIKADLVQGNTYNPNSVAPPEMELLKTSILADGYTQPIVANYENDGFVVVDGFHRTRVGKENIEVGSRVHGYLPIVQIRDTQVDVPERMASTIRHNRARGKHKVEAMSDIVIELKRRNWTNTKIAKELGMDQDEILRLCQISGLSELFSGQEFSKSWEPQGHMTPEDFEEISGRASDYGEQEIMVRTANTNDENRVFHTFEKWECYAAGFYETKPPQGLTADNCRALYRSLLMDISEFEKVLACVITEWRHSCEHYLTNQAMNRIAWLGQASLCYKHGIPSSYRGGYGLLTEDQQLAADEAALRALNKWMELNGRPAVSMADANPNRQSDIY